MVKKIKSGQTNITVRVVGQPDISERIIQRSYVRDGVFAGGTLLRSRVVTTGFTAQWRKSKSST
jgi:hypothetical protein